ncbi:hypothetical protein JKP88DRAFT_216908 [Tribonema minus]|uniref:Uncharacterized protein n=1 Tax=Tribonema minus TaxID=303371 RepID=A0A836CNC4_9STRA|nr:hypothetical protein JKP88DRAFT_216908 [Tribonema minus]
MKEMLRQLLDNKTGSKWKTISDANTEVWNIMRRKTGLEVMLYTAPLAVEPRRATIEPFGWDDRVEKAQADRYMPYLKALISPQDRSFELLDGNQHCSLNVDGVADILGYDFHGKPDAVLILRGSRLSPQTALRVVFELKKELNAAAHYQAMVTLVLANYHSSRLKPIVILTDLRGDYAFYWLDGRTLHYIELDRDSAKLAWGFFDAILQSERTDLAAGVVPHEGLEAPPPVKRQRLVFESSDTQDVANVDDLTGLLEPSELRAYTLAQFIQSLHGRPAVAAACNAYASMYV